MVVHLGIDREKLHLLLSIVDWLLLLARRSIGREDCLRSVHRLLLRVGDEMRAGRLRSVGYWVWVLHHVFGARCEDVHMKSMRLLMGDKVPVELSALMAWLRVVIEKWLRSILHCE